MDAIDALQNFLVDDDFSNVGQGSYDQLPSGVRDFLEVGLPSVEDRAEDSDLRIANLSDFQQAFPRIAPGFIQQVIMSWRLPMWLIVLAMTFLYGRSERIRLRCLPWYFSSYACRG